METPNDFAFLWDGTQPGWVLLRVNRQKVSVVIKFPAGSPTLREIAAVRAAVPDFAKMSTEGVFTSLKGQSYLALGDFDSKEARWLAEKCKQRGLTVEIAAVDASGYLPFNEQTKHSLIIEDDDLARSVYEEALARGIPVRHLEA
jgi:hypothetical protein